MPSGVGSNEVMSPLNSIWHWQKSRRKKVTPGNPARLVN